MRTLLEDIEEEYIAFIRKEAAYDQQATLESTLAVLFRDPAFGHASNNTQQRLTKSKPTKSIKKTFYSIVEHPLTICPRKSQYK